MLYPRFHQKSGDVQIYLHGFLDWMKFIFGTPKFFKFSFTSHGQPVSISAPRRLGGPVNLLRLDFKWCTPRLRSEDIHEFMLSDTFLHKLSNGQFAVWYFMTRHGVRQGDYCVYINTSMSLPELLLNTRGISIPDSHGALAHSVNEIVTFIPPQELQMRRFLNTERTTDEHAVQQVVRVAEQSKQRH